MDTGRGRQDGDKVRKAGPNEFLLRLFITGQTARSSRCLQSVRLILEKYLDGKGDLEVVDICQQPGMARDAQILAAPTLIKERPLPVKRLVGELSELPRVLSALGITEAIRQ